MNHLVRYGIRNTFENIDGASYYELYKMCSVLRITQGGNAQDGYITYKSYVGRNRHRPLF